LLPRYVLVVDDHPLVRDGLICTPERPAPPDGEGLTLLAEARLRQPRAAGLLLPGVDDARLYPTPAATGASSHRGACQ
jgi:hypothetical protein